MLSGMDRSLAFIAAPLLITVYGVVRILDHLDGERGPGPAWTTGHLAFLAALLLFVPVVLALRGTAGRDAFATGTAGVALLGTACTVVQVGVDLVIGVLAADHDDMRAMFVDVHDIPGVDVAVYEAGPVLFFLGLLVLFCRPAVFRSVPVWRAAALVLGVLISPVGLDLLPVVGLLLFAGLAPFARRTAPSASSAPARG